jgi:hypothetical protein
VKDEASFFDINGGNFAWGWQKVSSIEGKHDRAFSEEMFHISHFHMSLRDSKAKT